ARDESEQQDVAGQWFTERSSPPPGRTKLSASSSELLHTLPAQFPLVSHSASHSQSLSLHMLASPQSHHHWKSCPLLRQHPTNTSATSSYACRPQREAHQCSSLKRTIFEREPLKAVGEANIRMQGGCSIVVFASIRSSDLQLRSHRAGLGAL